MKMEVFNSVGFVLSFIGALIMFIKTPKVDSIQFLYSIEEREDIKKETELKTGGSLLE